MEKTDDMHSDILQQTQQPKSRAGLLTPTVRLRWQKRVVAIEVGPGIALG